MTIQKPVMMFGGVAHYLDQVLAAAKAGPLIEMNIDDANLKTIQQTPPNELVEFIPPQPELNNGEVIVFKQNSLYTIFTGKDKVWERLHGNGSQIMKVRLISTPALKKTRVPDPVAEYIPATIPPKPYDSAFANRPTFHKR
jgi:hypothetical protein